MLKQYSSARAKFLFVLWDFQDARKPFLFKLSVRFIWPLKIHIAFCNQSADSISEFSQLTLLWKIIFFSNLEKNIQVLVKLLAHLFLDGTLRMSLNCLVYCAC